MGWSAGWLLRGSSWECLAYHFEGDRVRDLLVRPFQEAERERNEPSEWAPLSSIRFIPVGAIVCRWCMKESARIYCGTAANVRSWSMYFRYGPFAPISSARALMPLHVEIQHARPAWLSLSISDRIEYLDRVGRGLRSLLDSGVELVGFVLNDAQSSKPADYHYIAVWYVPDGQAQIRMLESILGKAGWDEYFEPVDRQGERSTTVAVPFLSENVRVPPVRNGRSS